MESRDRELVIFLWFKERRYQSKEFVYMAQKGSKVFDIWCRKKDPFEVLIKDASPK